MGQRSVIRINPTHTVGWNQDTGQGLEHVKLSRPFRPQDVIVSHNPGRCPGLRDNAPLALKEGRDFNLCFSIWRSSCFFLKAMSKTKRINGPTARDSFAQPNGLGLIMGESSGPKVRDPDQSHTYRSS